MWLCPFCDCIRIGAGPEVPEFIMGRARIPAPSLLWPVCSPSSLPKTETLFPLVTFSFKAQGPLVHTWLQASAHLQMVDQRERKGKPTMPQLGRAQEAHLPGSLMAV